MIHDAEEALKRQSLSIDGHPLGNSVISSAHDALLQSCTI
jgi:hypothetical protein